MSIYTENGYENRRDYLEQLPTRLPRFLTDFKPSNFGLFKGAIVCHDYGMNLLRENGMGLTLRKVHWDE